MQRSRSNAKGNRRPKTKILIDRGKLSLTKYKQTRSTSTSKTKDQSSKNTAKQNQKSYYQKAA